MNIHLNVHKDNDTVKKIKAAQEEKNRAAFKECKESSQFIRDARDKLRALRCKDCKLKFSSAELCTEHMKQCEKKVPIPENKRLMIKEKIAAPRRSLL